jgi:cyclic pyranopterin phosphate synthase
MDTDFGVEGPGASAAHAVDYLRMSITDRCNLRCVYCMPAEGVQELRHEDILTYEELLLFANAAVDAGITRVRITGGEPLVRKGAVDFIGMLTGMNPGIKVSLTTNGTLISRHASELKRAGLRRVNISLDTLEPEVYRRITRVGRVQDALDGLRRSIEVGLSPVKLNVVVLKGLNDDPTAFADLTRELPVHVRFIEYMPYFDDGRGRWFVPTDVIMERIEEASGALEEVTSPEGWGPARYYRLPGAEGTVGFISPVSCHFCPSCNRIRISAEGRMRTCLFDSNGVDVRREVRSGADRERLGEIIRGELERKSREGHHKPGAPGIGRVTDHMSRIGG